MSFFILNDNPLFYYGVQYPLSKVSGDTYLYVIHNFDLEDNAVIPGFTLTEVMITMFVVVASIMFFGAVLIYGGISKSIQALQAFSEQQHLNLSREADLANLANEGDAVAELRFTEFQLFAGQLKDALVGIYTQTHKERAFIQSLSHELRTPMAITSVALDLLQRKPLSEDVSTKLQKIRVANNNMIAMANTLLNIWQNEHKESKPQHVSILNLIEQIIEENTLLYKRSDLKFELKVEPELKILVSEPHLRIVLTNLIKNAMQYGQAGVINIKADDKLLTVRNALMKGNSLNDASSEINSYGYGLGLYIAEQAAKNQLWGFQVIKGLNFEVKLTFK